MIAAALSIYAEVSPATRKDQATVVLMSQFLMKIRK